MNTPRYSTCIALITVLVICIAHSDPGVAAQSQRAVSVAPASESLLSDDLLNRMIAVAREGRALEQTNRVGDEESDDGDVPGSAEAIGDRMDANPVVRAMLRRHGFTGRSYLLAMATLARAGGVARMAGTKWASSTPGNAAVDPRNVAFYNEHKAKIATLAALNISGYSREEDERMTNNIRSIDPDDFDDCILLGPAVLTVVPHATTGSADAPPAGRLKLSDATKQFVELFKSRRLKRDFSVLADEVHRHAYEPRLESAAFGAALADVTHWAETYCKGANEEP